jgi:hypothetical protein
MMASKAAARAVMRGVQNTPAVNTIRVAEAIIDPKIMRDFNHLTSLPSFKIFPLGLIIA